MRKLRSEQEIMENWGGEHLKPVVSVCCITYNHEDYIEDALKGVLIQETDFPFEIVIHDDASTDNTKEIVRAYASAYPNIIKSILQTENQYSKKRFSFLVDVFQACDGEYIAICEGDDFWADKKKLLIQKEFLDLNNEYVVTTADAYVVYGTDLTINNSRVGNLNVVDFSKDDLIQVKYHMPTMNLFFRSSYIPKKYELADIENFDYFFVSYLGMFGKGYFHREIKPSYYRIHSEGVWSTTSQQQKNNMEMRTLYQMHKFYSKMGLNDYSNLFLKKFIRILFKQMKFSEIFIQTLNKFKSMNFELIKKTYRLMDIDQIIDFCKKINNKKS